MDDEALNFCSV